MTTAVAAASAPGAEGGGGEDVAALLGDGGAIRLLGTNLPVMTNWLAVKLLHARAHGGIGDALAQSLNAIGLPVIVAAFLIATALRVAQGSATVALTTTAGLIAPVVAAEALSPIDVALVVIAIAAGATVLSHVNDSGFWLVGRFLDMDVKTTLKTWTVMETLIGVVGFVLAFAASLVL